MEKLLHQDMAGDAPPCFSDSPHFGWQWWIEGEIEQYTEPNVNGYCKHCIPAYQRKMKAQGRCLHPDVTFSLSEDGFEGVRPQTAPIKWFTLVEVEE